jgi:hypothetical protein
MLANDATSKNKNKNKNHWLVIASVFLFYFVYYYFQFCGLESFYFNFFFVAKWRKFAIRKNQ